MTSKNIVFIGCGYVSGFYEETLEYHDSIKLIGAYDTDPHRLAKFCDRTGVHAYTALTDVLNDEQVDIVVNLTPPRCHFEVTKFALSRGKHVYSEKPLGWTLNEGQALVDLARKNNLVLAAAPCSALSEAAQTTWRAIRKNQLGKVRLVHAEMHDGHILRLDFDDFKSPADVPWPHVDELETGCVLEHAAYQISWLVSMFGCVTQVTHQASVLIPEKIDDHNLSVRSADYSIGILTFENGVIARVSNSIYADSDYSLKIFGDDAVLTVDNVWMYGSKVSLQKRFDPESRSLPLCGATPPKFYEEIHHNHDFCRGIAEVSDSLITRRECRLSAEFALHVDEICHALSDLSSTVHTIESRCAESLPMEWAEGLDDE